MEGGVDVFRVILVAQCFPGVWGVHGASGVRGLGDNIVVVGGWGGGGSCAAHWVDKWRGGKLLLFLNVGGGGMGHVPPI